MTDSLTFTVSDGAFNSYVARPAESKAPVVLVLQEIFGVNAVMRGVCDRLAAAGYLAVCPDLFWRIAPGVDITDKTEADMARAFELFGQFDVEQGMADIEAVVDQLREVEGGDGRVGAVGFCLGGKLAYLTATRTDADASVSFYGVGLEALVGEAEKLTRPLMLHIAEEDRFVPSSAQAVITQALQNHPQVVLHCYPGRDHAFAREGGENHDAEDAALAWERTLAFFADHLG